MMEIKTEYQIFDRIWRNVEHHNSVKMYQDKWVRVDDVIRFCNNETFSSLEDLKIVLEYKKNGYINKKETLLSGFVLMMN